MVALERINVHEAVRRKNNCKLNLEFGITKKYICLLKIVKNSRHKL